MRSTRPPFYSLLVSIISSLVQSQTRRIHIFILSLPQSNTNKCRHICTGPCRSVRLSRTCNLRDSLWCNHSAAVLCTLCLLLGGYSTQRPTSLHQCPPSPILLAVEARSVVRLPGSSNAQPDMLLSSHAEEAHPSSVEYC